MNKIDLIIDALSISQNSVWSALNEQALAAARELQAEYDKLTVKFGERAKEYLVAAKKSWQPEQEPVAYKYTHKTNPLVFYFTERKGKDVTQNPDVIETALYTAPPKREWVGLTDWERNYYNNRLSGSGVAEDIEFELKERNGG